MKLAWIELPQARELTAFEREVLAALVGHAASEPLAEQLQLVRVTGKCGCGCSSVRLETGGPRVPGAAMVAFSSQGRDDWFAIHATDGEVSAVAHIVQGRLHELELYAGEAVPVKPPVRLGNYWVG